MGPEVSLEQPWPGESLSAVIALAILIVSSQVHGKGRHGHVNLGAVRTPSGFRV